MQWLLASLIREMMRKAHPNFTGKNAETTAGNGSGIPLRDPLQRSPRRRRLSCSLRSVKASSVYAQVSRRVRIVESGGLPAVINE